ncbi:hypothetical protein HB364_22190 [Pseudoflavitalea sp. X16]|uniref:hypothetical protein n=1 Tax=Paraflavitalea devenefica TaxID=2716334 RepID=UPI0014207941|nr:hypothetical protein [Paraflavitalea devenefica]NII27809.1 hypothetical protein [Paraflavitalea devenefica]
MIMRINNKSQVSDVQREFNGLFPFLKLELFKHKHGYQGASPRQEKLPSFLYLGDLARQLPEQINIPESMTVQELEKLFEDQLGLHLQVFRKSGNLWLETTMTDGWTLKQQNDHGMEISLAPSASMNPATIKRDES